MSVKAYMRYIATASAVVFTGAGLVVFVRAAGFARTPRPDETGAGEF